MFIDNLDFEFENHDLDFGNLEFDLESIDFEFENRDFEIKFKNPQGLDPEKPLKLILESSFWTLTTSIYNLKITTDKADRQTKSGQHSSMRLTKLKNESSIKSTTTRAINSALHPRRQGYKQELTETDRLIA